MHLCSAEYNYPMASVEEKPKFKHQTVCYHCGDTCRVGEISYDDKLFCCTGCKSVYEILAQNNMCGYYAISDKPGVSQQSTHKNTFFDFLDDKQVQEQLVYFREGGQWHVKFVVPHMHCSSCIWLLENLSKLHQGVISSRVVFLDKEIRIVFDSNRLSLKELVILLKKVGYEPQLRLEDLTGTEDKKVNRTQLYKIGIAGFCFGNIMMLSLPDYFSEGDFLNDDYLNTLFNYLTLLLSLPVFFYAAKEFFVSSWQQLKLRNLNIDVPIALAILITFVVSVYHIVFLEKLGYMDTMSGIVFFMLVGRYFQNKSYNYLSFQKTFSSYLPIAVNKLVNGEEKNVAITDLKIGDELQCRQQEVIPADGILLSANAWFDYSFVTGESNWVQKFRHETIYAGAIQQSPLAQIKVSKSPSQSYITQLWNSRQHTKFVSNTVLTTERINVWFSAIVLVIGSIACMYWLWQGQSATALKALVTVWIVACPCALLLCSTFTFGNMLSILAHNKVYIKNAAVLEVMRNANALVFDKTGTITTTREADVDFVGRELSEDDLKMIYSVCFLSIHPLSKTIVRYLGDRHCLSAEGFASYDGKGIEAYMEGKHIMIGSAFWLGIDSQRAGKYTQVYVRIEDEIIGFFEIRNRYRNQVLEQFKSLEHRFDLHLLSGDNDAEKDRLSGYFKDGSRLHFNQMPEQKTSYIKQLQANGKTVLMIGDGLNDMNAFEQSDAGIAVIEDENNFLPSCDAIIHAEVLPFFDKILHYISTSNYILFITFSISLLYNVVGLYFAVQGMLTPVIAAILMPISTVSIVGLSFLLSRYFAKQSKLKT